MPELHTRRFLVRGRVTGVGFRAYVFSTADAFGLTGWVRNRDDDAVEIVAQGPPEALRDFNEQIEIGPSHARVDEVEVEEVGESETFRDFSIRR